MPGSGSQRDGGRVTEKGVLEEELAWTWAGRTWGWMEQGEDREDTEQFKSENSVYYCMHSRHLLQKDRPGQWLKPRREVGGWKNV